MTGRQQHLWWLLLVLLQMNFLLAVNPLTLGNKKQLLRLAKESLKRGKARNLFSKESVISPLIYDKEPTCEQLRAMWRLSRRQSRATILTNELPKFQDPFFADPDIRNEYRRAGASPIYGRMITHSNLWTENPLNRPNFVKMIQDKLRYPNSRLNMYQSTLRTGGGGFGTLMNSGHDPQSEDYTNSHGRFDQLRRVMYEDKLKEVGKPEENYPNFGEANKIFGRVIVSPEQRFRPAKSIRSDSVAENILHKKILDRLKEDLNQKGLPTDEDIFLLYNDGTSKMWKRSGAPDEELNDG